MGLNRMRSRIVEATLFVEFSNSDVSGAPEEAIAFSVDRDDDGVVVQMTAPGYPAFCLHLTWAEWDDLCELIAQTRTVNAQFAARDDLTFAQKLHRASALRGPEPTITPAEPDWIAESMDQPVNGTIAQQLLLGTGE